MILYKYLPPDRLDVLRNRRIRFTQPADFNDPFEFRPHIKSAASNEFVLKTVEENFDRLLEDELAKYGGMVTSNQQDMLRGLLRAQLPQLPGIFRRLDPDFIEMLTPAIENMLNKNVGVLCLSEIRDSLLMWGHYTYNHQGFVIGFDSEHPFFDTRKNPKEEFGFLRRVDYQIERPSVVLSDTSSPAWFQTKSAEWEYEKEWRIVRVLSEAEQRIGHDPFDIYLFGFPSDAVKEIIIGMRTPSSLVEDIEAVVSFFPNARLLQAREDPSAYALMIEERRAPGATAW